jgi:prepilin-type processing-associated H-X9-DG protein/prepilin-type N-terminal cleavage/methylation domain-containing protein
MTRRPGFTFVELLFVSVIIAILIMLLLPAVQSARESARRAQCSNNLMQLGIGMGSYASTHSVLPPGVVNDTGPIENLPYGFHHSWVIQVLPYIGQQTIYNHFNMKKSAYDPVHDTVAGIMIATLMCPSDGSRGIMSYAGCHNDVDAAISADNHGVLYLNSRVRYDEIGDGPGYTILLGEISGGGPSLGWVSGTRSTLRNTGPPLERSLYLAAKFTSQSTRDEALETVEALAEDGSWPVDLTGGFSSFHPGGSNFLFCDGSVRLLKNAINPHVYRLLGNRADGEMIGADQY